jgi:uncharacterized membrane protein
MMAPELGKAAFRWAIFLIVVAAGLLLTLSPGTPEFAITILTLLIGLIFVGVILLFIRIGRP